jgi:hypothetical protein
MNRTHCYIPIDKELVTRCICMFATYTDIKGEKKMIPTTMTSDEIKELRDDTLWI